MTVRVTPSKAGIHWKSASQNLTHSLVDTLSQSIHSSAIRPGDKLPSEAIIMAQYGVSRTVVREAITSLQATGLVETKHGIGSFVRTVPACFEFRIDEAEILTLSDVLTMLELRITIETDAAAFAAARRTDAQIEKMRRALDAFRANIKSGENAVEPDFQFHLQIANSTGNRYFIQLMKHLGTQSIPRNRLDPHQTLEGRVEYLNVVNDEHERIFDGIVRRDPGDSRAAMRTHLVSSRERLRRAHDLVSHPEMRNNL